MFRKFIYERDKNLLVSGKTKFILKPEYQCGKEGTFTLVAHEGHHFLLKANFPFEGHGGRVFMSSTPDEADRIDEMCSTQRCWFFRIPDLDYFEQGERYINLYKEDVTYATFGT